ncbi:MAG: prepilin-type N-terminal cleavage/methylation domain-containing protein, partial [Burkholderiales bacterium]
MLIRVRGLRGFTLLEIMVVIVILGILAALVVPKIIS